MKLLTKELRKRFAQIGRQGRDPIVIAKFFCPWSNWTWYATEFDPEIGMFFGMVEGWEREWGDFPLEELEELRGPGGLRIERDLCFEEQRISQFLKPWVALS